MAELTESPRPIADGGEYADVDIKDVQHGIDGDPAHDPEKGAVLGGVGGIVTGAIAGAVAGPVGAIIGAVAGGIAGAALSGAAVGAVDRFDNDNTLTGIGNDEEDAVLGNRLADGDETVVYQGMNVAPTYTGTAGAIYPGGSVAGGGVGGPVAGPIIAPVTDAPEAVRSADTGLAGAPGIGNTGLADVTGTDANAPRVGVYGTTSSTTADYDVSTRSDIDNRNMGVGADALNTNASVTNRSMDLGERPAGEVVDTVSHGTVVTNETNAGINRMEEIGETQGSLKTGGHALDGTPDTRGIGEKVADAVTGDHIDDKTGKRVS